MTAPLGIALFGCGGVSAGHFSAYAANPKARLVAAVDVRPELAEAAARKWGAERWYTSTAEALADSEVQIADLCLPHHLHAPVAIEAANAGKHVFVEKPIANTLDEADAMIAACRENNVLLMVDQTKRYQNRHRKLKELLDAGYVGDPILVRGAYLQDITYAWQHMEPARLKGYWKHDGVISGIGIHALDLLRWLIGEAAEVQAVASTSDMIDPARRTEDSGLVLLKFANGCIGEVTVSYVLKHPHLGASWDVMPIEIYGRDGSLQMDEHDTITVTSDKNAGAIGAGVFQVQTRPAVGAPRPPAEGMAGAIEHLLDCVLNGTQPLTHGEDARASLELVEAAYQSINEGRAVRLPLQPIAASRQAGGVR
ncbi:MAG: Gfo/Idh/MocA family oxidoreductase [Chloroflexota bacterium]|nr:Gfo/Idh/MocA family oxidoreductase [Chloroflexota bacterium]